MTTVDENPRTRARPLSSDDRRASIVDAAIPLIVQHGRTVTTRQIAQAAGVAEGTIFRVFVDKDALIEAAVDKFLDPEPLHLGLRAIDPGLPLEAKINDMLFQLRSRMTGIFGIMSAVGREGRPPLQPREETFPDVVVEVLAPDIARLNVPPRRVAQFVRLIAFASAIPQFNQGNELTTAELARFITYGIAGDPGHLPGADEGRSGDAA